MAVWVDRISAVSMTGKPGSAGGIVKTVAWSEEQSRRLQEVCDSIFQQDVTKLRFSFTIADPNMEGCPLVGCSTGFSELCGYTMEEIVGHNCRFLVDPVPQHLIDAKVRARAREFCDAVRKGRDYIMPKEDVEAWMPEAVADDSGIFCVQMNARKDGSLFKNMFFLKAISLSDNPYIVGLQSELPEENVTATLRKARQQLDDNMAEVERVLASMFWFGGGMRRQDDPDKTDGFEALPPEDTATTQKNVEYEDMGVADSAANDKRSCMDGCGGKSGDGVLNCTIS